MVEGVFETALPLAVRVVGGSFEDVGAVLADSLAQTVRVGDADHHAARAASRETALRGQPSFGCWFRDDQATAGKLHLDAMVADAQPDGEPERLAKPVRRSDDIGIIELGNDDARCNGTVG